MCRKWTLILVLLMGSFGLTNGKGDDRPPLKYPETERGAQIDTHHGEQVTDPYRWLETDVRESDRVAKWVKQENELTFAYLRSIPQREHIRKRLTALWDFPKHGTPFQRGDRYYFTKNDGLQNQSVLYTQETLDAAPQVLLDPNSWSKDGTVALAGMSFSDDGQYMAYGVATAGSDWRTWWVMEVASRRVLDESLEWVKFSSPAWTHDSLGFFYGRFAAPRAGATFQELNLNQSVYYHRIGTPQTQDRLVYKRPDHPDWGFGLDVTEDGRYLILTVWKGTDDKYRVLYRDLTRPDSQPVDLIEDFKNEYTFVGNQGSLLYFKTDRGAPRKQIVAIDLEHRERDPWRVVVGQRVEAMTS
ncbi:MAG: S9 family peptidase, partial [Planctomycetaceae bacterium]